MALVRLNAENPLTDGRQSETALAIRNGMLRHLEALGHAVLCEFPLANGRRADMLALDRKGRFTLIEIKSSIADFRADAKWPDYMPYCDRFAFATCNEVPPDVFPGSEGLFIADAWNAEMLREPLEQPLHASSRKALTLRFALLAARRAERISRYAQSNALPVDFTGEEDG